MDFANLPDNVFLAIFRQLPFKQQCRIGAVDRSFGRMSNIAISLTKSLRLDFSEFTNLPVDSLSKLFGLCRENLEEIHVPANFIDTFAEYSFPRLAFLHLSLDINHGFEWVDLILASNSALKEFQLSLSSNNRVQFSPTGVTNTNLVKLSVCGLLDYYQDERGDDYIECVSLDGSLFRSLAGRFPNLKRLEADMCEWYGDAQNGFDAFFAQSTTLEYLTFFSASNLTLNFFELESFWRMDLMRELDLPQLDGDLCRRGDDVLVKISNSFPHLEKLRLQALEITNRGVGALLSLKDLVVVDLPCKSSDLESSLFQLAQKGKLQEVCLNCWISPSTFLTVIGKCPNLGNLCLGGVRNLQNSVAAERVTNRIPWNQRRWVKILFIEQNVWIPGVVCALIWLKDKAGLAVKFDISSVD